MAQSSSYARAPCLGEAPWLTSPETAALFAALAAHGFEARAVGGAVRNALLGLPVVDVDIATAARPEQVMAAAEAAGLKTVPTGLAHGTVTVISGGRAYEVTTLREDIETFGRHATVAFTADWAADARRRDFTINALYCDAGGQVFDPLGVYRDLAARRVRFIGDASERIREDYLRILRFFRLSAEYGEGPPDAEALAASVREREGLALLSPERIRQEMLRLLAARRAVDLALTMFDYGLLPLVLGAAPRLATMVRLAALEDALGMAPDALLRLAALAVEIAEDADHFRDRWRLSNNEHDRLRQAAHAAELDAGTPEVEAKARLYGRGAQAYRDQVLLAWARSGDLPTDARWRSRWSLPERWKAPTFPLSGTDVMDLGVSSGPRVGELLRALEHWWIARDFSASEAELRTKLAQLAAGS